MLPWQPFLAFYIWVAHWRHLKNTTEPSMCGSNVALCQITLTTCYIYFNILIAFTRSSWFIHGSLLNKFYTFCSVVALIDRLPGTLRWLDEVEGVRTRGRPKKSCSAVVEKDCQICQLCNIDTTDCSEWTKFRDVVWYTEIQEVSDWIVFFWYHFTRIVLDKGPLNGLLFFFINFSV